MAFTTIKTTFSLSTTYFLQGMFEYTKRVIRSRKPKDKQYYGQKKNAKKTKNYGQNRKLKLGRREQHESH